MPRKKKTEVKEEVKAVEVKPVDYGTGRTRINNMLQAGYSLKEIMEEKRNE